MALNRTRLLILTTLLLIGAIAILFATKRQDRGPRATEFLAPALPDSTPNDAHNYKQVIAKLETERVALGLRYQAANSAQKADVMAQARTLVIRTIYSEIFPSWYGTAWDFNGTTEVPQQGKIACGYFVSTVLRDSGWKVERARLAQQASENIILSLTTDSYVKRFRRVAISDFVNTVKRWGPGLYVVGLDIHTGFIVNTGDEVYFIHSSYVEPYAVVREKAIESRILATSKYRVLGKLTDDDLFIEKWLLKTQIVTRIA